MNSLTTTRIADLYRSNFCRFAGVDRRPERKSSALRPKATDDETRGTSRGE
jgi:hypothetical protein